MRGGLVLDLGHGLLVGGHLLLELLDLLGTLDDGGLELVDLGGQLDPILLGLGGLPPDGGGLLLGVPERGGLLGLGLLGLLLLGLEVVGGLLPLLDVAVDVVQLPKEEVGLDLGLPLQGGVEPLGLLLLLLEAAALGLVPPELVVEEDGLRLGLLLGLEGVVVLGGHLGRSRYVLEHLDELLGGLAGDGLDVALEDEEVAGLDEDADLPEGILFWLRFGLYVYACRCKHKDEIDVYVSCHWMGLLLCGRTALLKTHMCNHKKTRQPEAPRTFTHTHRVHSPRIPCTTRSNRRPCTLRLRPPIWSG